MAWYMFSVVDTAATIVVECDDLEDAKRVEAEMEGDVKLLKEWHGEGQLIVPNLQ